MFVNHIFRLKRIRNILSAYNGKVSASERFNTVVIAINVFKGKIHCEIFLSEYFTKY